jgi:hypothetical protein
MRKVIAKFTSPTTTQAETLTCSKFRIEQQQPVGVSYRSFPPEIKGKPMLKKPLAQGLPE